MKVARTKNITTFRRPTPLRRKIPQKAQQKQLLSQQQTTPLLETKFDDSDTKTDTEIDKGSKSLSDGLAICLFGFKANMYVSEDEEEVRKRVIMSEVLPDEVMWAAWAKNEAPLRQGRGWYPALDRHFLELLVISEIQCLSYPLHTLAPAGQAERVHRHASRVRRVACERIGAERLHAYCERVKEAFEAYMHGAWGAGLRGYGGVGEVGEMVEDDEEGGQHQEKHSSREPGKEAGVVERGRSRKKGEGSVRRENVVDIEAARAEAHKAEIHTKDDRDDADDDVEVRSKMAEANEQAMDEVDMMEEPSLDPFIDEAKEMGHTTQGSELDEGVERDLLKIDLDDVQEADEERTTRSSEDMDIDIHLGGVLIPREMSSDPPISVSHTANSPNTSNDPDTPPGTRITSASAAAETVDRAARAVVGAGVGILA